MRALKKGSDACRDRVSKSHLLSIFKSVVVFCFHIIEKVWRFWITRRRLSLASLISLMTTSVSRKLGRFAKLQNMPPNQCHFFWHVRSKEKRQIIIDIFNFHGMKAENYALDQTKKKRAYQAKAVISCQIQVEICSTVFCDGWHKVSKKKKGNTSIRRCYVLHRWTVTDVFSVQVTRFPPRIGCCCCCSVATTWGWTDSFFFSTSSSFPRSIPARSPVCINRWDLLVGDGPM